MTTYTSQYPPAHNDTYVKATTKYSTSTWPYFATDPNNSLIDYWASVSWLSVTGTNTNQRFHIDLGEAKVIRRIYYENGHYSGTRQTTGVKDFTFWGSNDADAFAELTYETDTNWTQLSTSQSYFDMHVGSNVTDPKYITVANTTQYRYYAIKIANNYGSSTYIYMSVRRIELQTEDSAGTSTAKSCRTYIIL